MEHPATVNETATLSDQDHCDLQPDFEGLTLKLKQKAERELHETEESVQNGLQKIKQLIKEDGLVTCHEDEFILLFLRSKKFDVKRSYDQLKSYSYLRHVFMNYYGFISEENIMPAFFRGIVGILPKRDREGRVIIFFRASQMVSQVDANLDWDDVLRAVQVLCHFVLMYPANQISGFCLIADMQVDSVAVLHLLFKYVKLIISTIHCFPARIKKVDCINTNIMLRAMMKIVGPLIPSKIFKRLSFHGTDYKDLLKLYDASMLPKEFGGTLGPINELSKKYFLKIEQYISTLQASNRYFTRKDTITYPESQKELIGFFK